MVNKRFLGRFSDGQAYMEMWPNRKELAPIFAENRVIKATKFANKVMPAVAVISILTQMVFANQQALPQTLVIALFAISMPLQGLWWLGTRSRTTLPPQLATWYRDIHQKVVKEGFALEPMKPKPSYFELAKLLNSAFKQLDKGALERWF
ncbi:DUF412 domain-containing protein [Vibrio sp. SS-MA-C1-2]|uniref:terminus macrodomain insulation protein YfbV n=1 Tax=Vibrio sp. SS-MA-C1-2 TaxID=2908646 RepID=UPI001F384599|nr:terminus macrodomain insulation protein YfbV [Vibrio sp. SS-MA-C1-2]UJF18783.1 DUF412 domain-containing protein [Vibrio sp. SS-MA-C1-2]